VPRALARLLMQQRDLAVVPGDLRAVCIQCCSVMLVRSQCRNCVAPCQVVGTCMRLVRGRRMVSLGATSCERLQLLPVRSATALTAACLREARWIRRRQAVACLSARLGSGPAACWSWAHAWWPRGDGTSRARASALQAAALLPMWTSCPKASTTSASADGGPWSAPLFAACARAAAKVAKVA
jgi:hypothetical protein